MTVLHRLLPSPSGERVRVRAYETTKTNSSNSYSANSLTPTLSHGEREFSGTVLHRLQEDVFERITLESQPPNLHLRRGRQPVQIANLSSLLQDHFQTMFTRDRVFTAQRAKRRRECLLNGTRFRHQEFLVHFSLFCEVAVNGHAAIF